MVVFFQAFTGNRVQNESVCAMINIKAYFGSVVYFWGQNRLKQSESIVDARVHSWCLYCMGCITLCRGSVCWPFIQLKGRHSKNESMPAVLLFRSRPDKNHHSIQNCVILLAFFSWAINMISWRKKRGKKGNTGPCRFVYCLWRGGFLLDQWAPAAPLELKSCLSFVSARAFSAHAHHTKHRATNSQ